MAGGWLVDGWWMAGGAVENARDNRIQINVAQAPQANYHCILVVPRTSCEGMNPTVLAEEVIGELSFTVPGETLITLDHSELIRRDFLQDSASTNAK